MPCEPPGGVLAARALEFARTVEGLVPAAHQADLGAEHWGPLADLVAVDEFERIGIWREVMDWSQYVAFLERWAGAKGFETTVRRVSELPGLVYLEVEERHIKDGQVNMVNSMNVFEFDDGGKIRHLDVYLQGKLDFPVPVDSDSQ